MIRRLFHFIRMLLVGVDALAQTLIVGPFFIAGLAAKLHARETVSAMTGRRAMAGARYCRREALEMAQ